MFVHLSHAITRDKSVQLNFYMRMSPFPPEVGEGSIYCVVVGGMVGRSKKSLAQEIEGQVFNCGDSQAVAVVEPRFSLDCAQVQYLLPHSIIDLTIFVDEMLYLESR